jgi:putative transposase
MRFQKGCKNVYNVGYHVIWATKYRSQIMTGNFAKIIENALLVKAQQLEVVLEKYEIMPDHLHLFIKCTPHHKISEVIGQLKGYSSYILRKIYPKYRKKYKHLWSPSYYCETVGHISEATIKKYIDNQWQSAERDGKY